jgi:hypothetical protein
LQRGLVQIAGASATNANGTMNATLTEAALTAFKAAMVAASVANAGAIVVPRSSQTFTP